jgi:hypothetical protein
MGGFFDDVERTDNQLIFWPRAVTCEFSAGQCVKWTGHQITNGSKSSEQSSVEANTSSSLAVGTLTKSETNLKAKPFQGK